MSAPPSFTVVCICTGNICRSPAAERLLARALGPSVSVISAGTHALVGHPVSPPMDRLVESAGGDPWGFKAQLLDAPLLRGADLVLGLTRSHRAAAVDVAPATVRRAFTLREYARLVGELDPAQLAGSTAAEKARASLPLVAARRRKASPAEDDVPDPFRRSVADYEFAFGQIRLAVDQIASRLAAPA